MRSTVAVLLAALVAAPAASAQPVPPPPPPPGVSAPPPGAQDYGLERNAPMFGLSGGLYSLRGGSISGTAYDLMAHLGTAAVAASIGVMTGDLDIDDSGSLTGVKRKSGGYRFALGVDLFQGPAYSVGASESYQAFLLYPSLELRGGVGGDGFLAMGTLGVTGGRIALNSGARIDVRVPTVTAWLIPLEEADGISANFGYSIGAQLEIGVTKW